jgi:opacity protein-like surface antigen
VRIAKGLGFFLFCLLLATTARAQDRYVFNTGFYVQLTGLAIFPEDLRAFSRFDGLTGQVTADYDTGWGVGIEGGYRFANGLRLQSEFFYGRTRFDDVRGRVHVRNLFGEASVRGRAELGRNRFETFNGTEGLFYDFNTGSMFIPYLGAGIGGVHSDFYGTPDLKKTSDTSFTAFGEVGVEVKVAERLSLVPAYRFQWIDDGTRHIEDTRFHEATLGLRWYF